MMMMPVAALPTEGGSAAATALYKRLWVHEVFRVFYDRLVDDKDRTWLMEQLRSTTQSVLGESFDALMSRLVTGSNPAEGGAPADGGVVQVTHTDMRRCFFGDYMDSSKEAEDRMWVEHS